MLYESLSFAEKLNTFFHKKMETFGAKDNWCFFLIIHKVPYIFIVFKSTFIDVRYF